MAMKPKNMGHNPRLKASFLEVVDNQLKANDPPETRQTLDRLIAQGISQEDAKTYRLSGLGGHDMESVVKVVPQDDFQLLVTFNTGETRLFDARPYLEKGVFTRLKNWSFSSRLLSPLIRSASRVTWILPRKICTTVPF